MKFETYRLCTAIESLQWQIYWFVDNKKKQRRSAEKTVVRVDHVKMFEEECVAATAARVLLFIRASGEIALKCQWCSSDGVVVARSHPLWCALDSSWKINIEIIEFIVFSHSLRLSSWNMCSCSPYQMTGRTVIFDWNHKDVDRFTALTDRFANSTNFSSHPNYSRFSRNQPEQCFREFLSIFEDTPSTLLM